MLILCALLNGNVVLLMPDSLFQTDGRRLGRLAADRYQSFSALSQFETEGVDYRIHLIRRPSPVVVVAPHGGGIEPGTSEVATSIAAQSFSLYCFEGLLSGRPHRDLHITSERFDEPRGVQLVETSDAAVGVHGRKDGDDAQSVWLGGLNESLRDAVAQSLERVGFNVKTSGHSFPGRGKMNICNRGCSGGVQLELPRTLRRALVTQPPLLRSFAAAVRCAILLALPETAAER